MYIETSSQASRRKIIDDLTRRAAGILDLGVPIPTDSRDQTCACGATTSLEAVRYAGKKISPLAVHRLALHRRDVPRDERQKLEALQVPLVNPTLEALAERPTPL